ncbi:hypothetical protein QFZ27_001910 [Inquilinus ginsengisoli]|uniref:hypothetical protein n=1 Tax=Inquilinus ginsengisoli TaxID=363840 RepID=UPI003D1F1475
MSPQRIQELRPEMSGEQVTLEGVASDFKAAAGVVLDGGGSVLLEGKRWWEPKRRGQRVTVAGVLRFMPPGPDEPGAAQRQQTPHGRWTLENPQVEDEP